MWADIALVCVFFLIGAVFAASEMALVSLRDSQIKRLSGKGKRGRAIVELTSNPNRFLSAVQIGVTLSGFLSSSFGSATLATHYMAPWLASLGIPEEVAPPLAVVIVTIIISYFSIVISELTAKRLAMQNAERYALVLGPFINGIAKLFRPVIWLLDISTNVLVKMLGGDPEANKEIVTSEEIRSMVASSETLGEEERQIVDEVFSAGDSSLREVMVPRTEVDFLPGDMPAYRAIQEVRGEAHSRYPITDGSVDSVVGFIHIRDLARLDQSTKNAPIRQLARPILHLPETVNVLRALTAMRREHAHIAIVTDEYGGTAGIVSLEDLVEEFIGDITDEYDIVDEAALMRHRLEREVNGLMTLEEFNEKTNLVLPEGPYDTVVGYFMALTGKVPEVGDKLVVELEHEVADEDASLVRVEFTVKELDGRRAAWLHARRVAEGDLTESAADGVE